MTKSEWVNNTSLIFMTLTSGYDFEDAKTEVETYLSSVAGGWNPDDVGEPNGDGVPTNSDTPLQAAEAIFDQQIDDTKTITTTVDVTLKLTQTGSFSSGVSSASIVNALKTIMEARITSELDIDSGIQFVEADWDNANTDLRETGLLDSAEKVEIQNNISNNLVLVDPASIATNYVRNTYNLNNTWISEKAYNRGTNYPIIVYIGKYTDTTYATQDTTFIDGDYTVTYEGYVVQVDPDTHRVQTCSVYPTQTRTLT